MKSLIIPLTVFTGVIPPLIAFGLTTLTLMDRYGKYVCFLTAPIFVLSAICYVKMIDGLRAERQAMILRQTKLQQN